MRPVHVLVAFVALQAVIGLATGAAPAPATEPLEVFVSIQPQAYFVERIGGERVRPQVLVKPGESPATYAPTPRQMAALAKAKALFHIGVPFEEALIPRIERTMEGLLVVDTRRGIRLRPMEARHHHPGQTGRAYRNRGGMDPHTWLSPVLAKRQARTIFEALVRLDPAGESEYRANYRSFVLDLDALHRRLTEVLSPLRGRKLFVFHPAYGYFAEAYGLTQVPVEIEGKEPTPKELARLIEAAKAHNAKVIFVQPQFSTDRAEAVASAIGGAVVALDPLAKDYIRNLERMAEKIELALAREPNVPVRGDSRPAGPPGEGLARRGPRHVG
jgi:zinc transport system substrate-binding protein